MLVSFHLMIEIILVASLLLEKVLEVSMYLGRLENEFVRSIRLSKIYVGRYSDVSQSLTSQGE